MNKNKLVTYKRLKIGQKIEGTEGNGSHHFFCGYVKAINPAYVTVEMFEKGGKEERIDSSLMFSVEMSEKEFEQKYLDGAKEVLKNIQNKLHGDEIGYHEMWNSWLYGTPYEIACECAEKKIKIIGYSSDITPKYAWFSRDILDVGVCAEYEDGERFWCHYKLKDIEEMVKYYKNLLN